MKISVVMVDGGFRENVYSARYFTEQDFSEDQYEVIWVEFYDNANKEVREIENVRIIELGKTGLYHSSYCFNAGICAARGDIIVIPDADQIVGRNFLSRVYEKHSEINNLVSYGFRYDETEKGALKSHNVRELEAFCKLKNPCNYGGCLTVRKEILLKINGYEQHEIFGSGFHANGLDLYTRFKNMGLPIMWDKELILYHPWHESTLSDATEYRLQKAVINWRAVNLQYMALLGIDESINSYDQYHEEIDEISLLKTMQLAEVSPGLLRRVLRKIKNIIRGFL